METETETETVIHYGSQLSTMIYDHNIGVEIWQNKMESFERDERFNLIEKCREYKVYQIDELLYQFDKHTTTCMTYIEHIDDYECLSNALIYQHKKEVVDVPFLPINRYQTHFEISRTTYCMGPIQLCFEQREQDGEVTYEMYLVIPGTIKDAKDVDFYANLYP